MFVANVSEILLPTAAHLFALILILAAIVFRPVQGAGPRPRRLKYAVLFLLIWSYCLSTPRIGNALVRSLESRFPLVTDPGPRGEPLILVLSGGAVVQDGSAPRLDRPSWERTWAGIRLWKKVGGQLLFAGGPPPDQGLSTAAAMASVAAEAGVPVSDVLLESGSRNTYENLAFNRERAASRAGNVWLVTSALHMRRAMAVAAKLGMSVRPYPCDRRAITLRHWYSWLPNSGGPALFEEALQEWLGLLYYRLRGSA